MTERTFVLVDGRVIDPETGEPAVIGPGETFALEIPRSLPVFDMPTNIGWGTSAPVLADEPPSRKRVAEDFDAIGEGLERLKREREQERQQSQGEKPPEQAAGWEDMPC